MRWTAAASGAADAMAFTFTRDSRRGRFARRHRCAGQPCLTGVGGFQKELGLFDRLAGRVDAGRRPGAGVPPEQVLGELPAREPIEEDPGVEEAGPNSATMRSGSFGTSMNSVLIRPRAACSIAA